MPRRNRRRNRLSMQLPVSISGVDFSSIVSSNTQQASISDQASGEPFQHAGYNSTRAPPTSEYFIGLKNLPVLQSTSDISHLVHLCPPPGIPSSWYPIEY
jgi:hypothetical protein